MKLIRSIMHALTVAVVIALILLGIFAAVCILIESLWLVSVLTGISIWIPIAVLACVAVVLGFILEVGRK